MSDKTIRYAVNPSAKPPRDDEWRTAVINQRTPLHSVAENIARSVHGCEKRVAHYVVFINDPEYPAPKRFAVAVELELKFQAKLTTIW